MNGFNGPLFIVGVPRSGTKLIRALLNEHPKISIPISETNFIPSFVQRYGDPPPFLDHQRFNEFYEYFSKTWFYRNRMQISNRVLSKSDLLERADVTSWSSIFEVILKYYAPEEVFDDNTIWGDKSPSYVLEMPLLKSLYPFSKIIHIIRDPRDVSLSVKKTWGKNFYSTSEAWRRDIRKARIDGANIGLDYTEIQFENLLSDTETILKEICNFLKIDFVSNMIHLSRSPEPRGDARGEFRVVKENQKKYLTNLSPATIKRIEEITFPEASALGYEIEIASKFKPLRPIELRFLSLTDSLTMTMFYMKNKGVSWGTKYFLDNVPLRFFQ